MFHLVYRYKMSESNNNTFISECTIESICHELGSNQLQLLCCFHFSNWILLFPGKTSVVNL